MNYFVRVGMSALVTGLNEEPFVKLTADSYITGYDNKLVALSEISEYFTGIEGHEKAGLMIEVCTTYSHVCLLTF